MKEEFNKNICIQECPIGKAKSQELLDKYNSAFDAASEMWVFVEQCSQTCERCQRARET